jgi:DNA-binding MarR family transcriptional regulator
MASGGQHERYGGRVARARGGDIWQRRMARQRNVAYSVFLTGGLMGRLLEEELRPFGVTGTEVGLLSAIGRAGKATPSALSEQLGTRPTTLSSQIRGLIARGYVRRLDNPADGRSYLLELTAEGEQAWTGAMPALRATLLKIEQELEVPIDDVEEALVALERGLRRSLGEDPSAPDLRGDASALS